ncbi:MAG: hypothetical protein K8R25_08140 [Methanosarcinales archaeon]|nr:hypothetical protein [Methanosarcinales archaeon]
MKIKEKFLIKLSLNGKNYPIYWLTHELKNSESNIYFGSYIEEHESIKTSVHSSGEMHIKEKNKIKATLSYPIFSQELDSFKGIKQIHAGLILKNQIQSYNLKSPKKIDSKQIIDIDVSSFKDIINLQIAILENENYHAIELYKEALHIQPKYEEIIRDTSPWIYILAF